MSKICENCGNMIPDGADICPGCGRKQYREDALETILSELSFSLDELSEEEPQDQHDDVLKEALTDDLDQLPQEEAEELAPKEAEKKSVDPAIAAIGEETQKKMAAPGKKNAGNKNSAAAAGKKRTGKKKASASGSSALAIIVGILIALLLVAGAAFFMLYRMGFFDLMNGDQLLAQSPAQNETLSAMEATPNVVEVPAVAPEEVPVESVVEEPASVVEAQEDTTLPELSIEEPEAPLVEVDKFNLTGADDMTFTSRGETAQIVYVIAPESAEPEIQWESSDETIATVSASGVITARRGGDCTVTGTCGDKEVSVKVRCSFNVPTTVLDMNYSDITMDHEGQSVLLKIDYDLTEEQINATLWESSDPEVVSVDDEGNVTALKNGTVVVSASIGDYTASCIVRCVNVEGNKGVNPEDSEYVINYEDVTLSRKGEYFQLSLKSILGNEVPEYTWESSDSSIATVDSKGVVTAVANGTCEVTTTLGGDDFACIVRVHISG